jgi:hypothetical protein
MAPNSMVNCRNCHKPLPGQADFCPSCGQSVKAVKRPWRDVFGELLTELFDFDGRMFLTLRLLLTRPGFLSLEYVNDRRLSYTSPIRLYLVVSLVFFFVLPMISPEPPDTNLSDRVTVDQYSQAMFLLLPVFGLVLKVFYRRTYYLPHLVFTLYLFSAMYIVLALMLSIETLADRYLAVVLLQVLLLAYMLSYFAIALRVAYRESWPKTLVKSLGLLVIFSTLLRLIIELASYLKFAI